jgi:catechol 2,3-dioxygenase-like lactoylglutathione lyase family enzyme
VLNGLYLNMVKRIVLNIDTRKIAEAASFYKDVLGLDLMMDHGWIATYGVEGQKMDVQLSFASEGGSGTPTPDLSIEVENVDEVLGKVKAAGFPVEYGPVNEPWGVRRFYTRDPFGKLVNILSHY